MKLYRNVKKDGHDALIQKGTCIDASVTKIEKTRKGWKVTVVATNDDFYRGKEFTELFQREPECRLGGEVGLYIDDVDADGEFAIDV